MNFIRKIKETEDLRKITIYTSNCGTWKIYKEGGRSEYGNDFYVFNTKEKNESDKLYGQFKKLKEAKKYISLFK